MQEGMSTKELRWVGSSLNDVSALPYEAKRKIGYALRDVQEGLTPADSKPLPGLGAKVWEIAVDARSDTYRAIYTLQLTDAIYVLHVFQKKSKHGKAMPREDIEVIQRRLQRVLAGEV